MFRASSGNYFLLMDYGSNINLGKPHLSFILNRPTSFCGSLTKTQIIVLEKRIIDHIQIMFFPVRFVPSQMDIYMWMLPMARSRIWITSSNMYFCYRSHALVTYTLFVNPSWNVDIWYIIYGLWYIIYGMFVWALKTYNLWWTFHPSIRLIYPPSNLFNHLSRPWIDLTS